jgi:hypothetical protein
VRALLGRRGELAREAGVAGEVEKRGGAMTELALTPDEIEALAQLNALCSRWIGRLPRYEGSLLEDFFELYADTGWLLSQHRARLAEDPLEQIPVTTGGKFAALRRKMLTREESEE